MVRGTTEKSLTMDLTGKRYLFVNHACDSRLLRAIMCHFAHLIFHPRHILLSMVGRVRPTMCLFF